MKQKCDKSVGFELFSLLAVYFWQEHLMRGWTRSPRRSDDGAEKWKTIINVAVVKSKAFFQQLL